MPVTDELGAVAVLSVERAEVRDAEEEEGRWVPDVEVEV
jgi:hypothetical protein